MEVPTEPEPSIDDLLALADAVREVGFSYDQPMPDRSAPDRRGSSGPASSSSVAAAISPCWPIPDASGLTALRPRATRDTRIA